MTVTLKATGATDVVICHGADQAGVAGKFVGPLGRGRSETSWKVQPSEPVRSANRRVFDRLNAAHAFDLEVWVEFATEALATSFRLSWSAGLPRTGASLVVAHDGGATQTYASAVLENCVVEQDGVGCLVRYRFQTGAPVTT